MLALLRLLEGWARRRVIRCVQIQRGRSDGLGFGLEERCV